MAHVLVDHQHVEALAVLAQRLDARGLSDESQALKDIVAEIDSSSHEVSASIAAEILAVTPQTVRNWVRGAVLKGRRDRTGHFYVSLDALEPAIRMRQALHDAPAGAITDAEIDAEIEAVRAERRARVTRPN